MTAPHLSNSNGITGSASATLTIANIVSAEDGSYNLIVTNAAGSATSSVATLTVIVPPSFSTEPASETNNQGATAVFTAVVSGSAPFAYQWLDGSTALADGSGIHGSQVPG